ncbi:hypothetical protein BCR42DRAFT_430129 [Absidia repens]|uniref:Uncharacterized protein n=1 Tax=Absidia repens TaxID=90262 RepID=A0A1X2HLQ9_9FUNG|nr:hypothetical protein BCR42DRAFT_430129 [Absidia repens]
MKDTKGTDNCARLLKESVLPCKRLGVSDASADTLDIVSIPAFPSYGVSTIPLEYDCCLYFLILVGSFTQNKWMIPRYHYFGEPSNENRFFRRYHDDKKDQKPMDFLDIY